MNEILPPATSSDMSMLAPVTPMAMLSMAVSRGADVTVLKELMALQERWEAHQARKAFDAAISAAKAEIPVIDKNKHVGFESKKAGAASTDYWHEDLAEIARTVDPILGRHGLSYRFRVRSVPNEPVTVTCILSHKLGHFEENPLSAGRDDTGNKNSLQAVGSTLTYLQRYTLKASLGLAASKDDDGKKGGGPELVNDDQLKTLQNLISTTKADIGKFLAFFKAESLSDLPQNKMDEAVKMLNAKAAQKVPA